MSQYKNFIQDFPARCEEVLKHFYKPAETKDREVTLLIMTASAAFLVPFERLRGGMSIEHRAQDRKKFPKLAKHLDSELGKPFLTSRFYEKGSGPWFIGKSEGETPVLNPPMNGRFPEKTPTGQVLGIIRNALAHGNILTLSDTADSPIARLLFWAEDRNRKDGDPDGYKYVDVSPNDFYSLLINWFEFLNLPEDVTNELKGTPPACKVAETLALAETVSEVV
jgi:hypothetical protein